MNKLFCLLLSLFPAAASLTAAASSQTYRERYAAVLEHYSAYAADSMKYKAALFLIDNMDGHVSPEGAPIEEYAGRVASMGPTTGIRRLQSLWGSASKAGKVVFRPDSTAVTDSFLIDNIDSAFVAWQSAPWRSEVPFGLFCRYILPYRINDEHIGREWRGVLRERYLPLVKDVKDLRRAFAVVRDSVFKDVALSNKYCPYTLDPLTCFAAGRAECGQRCIALAAALRSVGIPAAVDVTPMWADYSNKGHAWVAVVASGGATYTVSDRDSVARQFNPVDASRFVWRYKFKPEEKFPYAVKSRKTPVKVYRMSYERCNESDPGMSRILASPFIRDVSRRYGLDADIRLQTDCGGWIYLCAYLSGSDWMPVAKAKAADGEVVFAGVGKGAVCVPAVTEGGRRRFLSCPFLVGDSGIVKEFIPSGTGKRAVTLNRKYPLCSYTTDTWAFFRGGAFEASNTETFSHPDTLAVITTVPWGMTEISVSTKKKYRYFRYHAPLANRSSLAELQFYATDGAGGLRLLTGKHFAAGVEPSRMERAFDGNPATAIKALDTGYTIGLDLGAGNESAVAKIVFSPSTDLNFVERGHLYELYYFDTAWHLLGRTYSKGDTLTFAGVPDGALLLLKDKTAGREERIFEYADGRQVWH